MTSRPARRFKILNYSSRTEQVCKELQAEGYIAKLSRVVPGDWPMAITTNASITILAMDGLSVELIDL